MKTSLTRAQIEHQVKALGPWFHNIDLAGIQTAPEHFLGDYPRARWQRFSHAVSTNLTGKSILDVGCNAGYYAIEMKRRGAHRVLGIDSNEASLEQARFAARVSGVDVEFRRMSVYDLPELSERFDVVLFLGVFNHLRHPLLALDVLHEYAVGDTLVFQSALRGDGGIVPIERDYPFTETAVFHDPAFPRMHFIERQYAGDPTHWWIPNRSCTEAMLRSAGFEIVSHPTEEVFVCRPRPPR
jgi:tRNA (mo5U34)-methyltransferase